MKSPTVILLAFKNQETGDTSSSRILVLRYDKDLNILCSNTYIARDKEITIRDVTIDENGNYYLSVGYATKENSFSEINTTIIKVNKDCDIPGMETVEEYLGELSVIENENSFGFHVLQNPAVDNLVL